MKIRKLLYSCFGTIAVLFGASTLGVAQTNQLVNGDFETPPAPPNAPLGNLLGSSNISPWIINGGSENVVLVDGNPFWYSNNDNGPYRDASGSGAGTLRQYLDIDVGSAALYQVFTTGECSGEIRYGGFFSTRQNRSGVGGISIREGSGLTGNLIVNNEITLPGGDSGDDPWTPFNFTATLAANTQYSFIVIMDNQLNFDEAFVEFQTGPCSGDLDFSVDKQFDEAQSSGEDFVFTIAVGGDYANLSAGDKIRIYDFIPAGASYVSHSPADWSCTPFASQNLVECDYIVGSDPSMSPPLLSITFNSTEIEFENCVEVMAFNGVTNSGYQDSNSDNDRSCATGENPPPPTDPCDNVCEAPGVALSCDGSNVIATVQYPANNAFADGEQSISTDLQNLALTAVNGTTASWLVSGANAGDNVTLTVDSEIDYIGTDSLSQLICRNEVGIVIPLCDLPVITTTTTVIDLAIEKDYLPSDKEHHGYFELTVSGSQGAMQVGDSVVISDTLPAGMSYVSHQPSNWACSTSPSGSSQTVGCQYTLGSFPPPPLELEVFSKEDFEKNCADVTGYHNGIEVPETNNNNNEDCWTTEPRKDIDLSIEKYFKGMIEDGVFEFRIEIGGNGQNLNPGDVIVVQDNLPAGATLVNSIPSNGLVCSGATNIICTYTMGSFSPVIGALLHVRTDKPSIQNCASVSAHQGGVNGSVITDVNPENNNDCSEEIHQPPQKEIDLKITKKFDYAEQPYYVFTLEVEELTAGLQTGDVVRITDIVAAGTDYYSHGPNVWNCSQSGGTGTPVICDYTLGANPPPALSLKLHNKEGFRENCASVSALSESGQVLADINRENNQDCDKVVVEPRKIDLGIEKVYEPSGTENHYLFGITVSSHADDVPAGQIIRVTDHLPAGASMSGFSPNPPWNCQQMSSIVSCEYTSTGSGVPPMLTLDIYSKEPLQKNCAQVSNHSGLLLIQDVNDANNEDCTEVTSQTNGSLTITKAQKVGECEAGQPCVFNITFQADQHGYQGNVFFFEYLNTQSGTLPTLVSVNPNICAPGVPVVIPFGCVVAINLGSNQSLNTQITVVFERVEKVATNCAMFMENYPIDRFQPGIIYDFDDLSERHKSQMQLPNWFDCVDFPVVDAKPEPSLSVEKHCSALPRMGRAIPFRCKITVTGHNLQPGQEIFLTDHMSAGSGVMGGMTSSEPWQCSPNQVTTPDNIGCTLLSDDLIAAGGSSSLTFTGSLQGGNTRFRNCAVAQLNDVNGEAVIKTEDCTSTFESLPTVKLAKACEIGAPINNGDIPIRCTITVDSTSNSNANLQGWVSVQEQLMIGNTQSNQMITNITPAHNQWFCQSPAYNNSNNRGRCDITTADLQTLGGNSSIIVDLLYPRNNPRESLPKDMKNCVSGAAQNELGSATQFNACVDIHFEEPYDPPIDILDPGAFEIINPVIPVIPDDTGVDIDNGKPVPAPAVADLSFEKSHYQQLLLNQQEFVMADIKGMAESLVSLTVKNPRQDSYTGPLVFSVQTKNLKQLRIHGQNNPWTCVPQVASERAICVYPKVTIPANGTLTIPTVARVGYSNQAEQKICHQLTVPRTKLEKAYVAQLLANAYGENLGSVDGKLGKKSKRAITQLQKRLKITADGIAGKGFFRAFGLGDSQPDCNIISLPKTIAAPKPKPVPKPADNGQRYCTANIPAGDSLNGREGAGTNYKVRHQFGNNICGIRVVETKGNWAHIVYQKADVWVSKKYLRKEGQAAPKPKPESNTGNNLGEPLGGDSVSLNCDDLTTYVSQGRCVCNGPNMKNISRTACGCLPGHGFIGKITQESGIPGCMKVGEPSKPSLGEPLEKIEAELKALAEEKATSLLQGLLKK